MKKSYPRITNLAPDSKLQTRYLCYKRAFLSKSVHKPFQEPPIQKTQDVHQRNGNDDWRDDDCSSNMWCCTFTSTDNSWTRYNMFTSISTILLGLFIIILNLACFQGVLVSRFSNRHFAEVYTIATHQIGKQVKLTG